MFYENETGKRTLFRCTKRKEPVCDANSGLINLAGGVVIDTQSDLAHAKKISRTGT